MTTPEAITSDFLDRDSLLNQITVRDEKIIRLDQENHHLKEQLAWFKRQIFGKRSEREVSNLNSQQLILEGFESPAHKAEEKKKVAAHERKKPNSDGIHDAYQISNKCDFSVHLCRDDALLTCCR